MLIGSDAIIAVTRVVLRLSAAKPIVRHAEAVVPGVRVFGVCIGDDLIRLEIVRALPVSTLKVEAPKAEGPKTGAPRTKARHPGAVLHEECQTRVQIC
jgi:hypothetical protein